MKANFRPLDMHHYRFERQCENFYPNPDSPSVAWWLAGAGVACLLLAAVIA